MPSSEKSNRHNTLNAPSIPTDLPPSYENTILPITAPSPGPIPSQPIAIPSQNPLSSLSRLSSISFTKYRVRDSKLSDDQTTLTTTSTDLASTQYALVKFIHEQARLPPKPLMVIKGTHLGSGVEHGQPVVDFELKFNLTSMLDLDGDEDTEPRSERRRVRVKAFRSSGASGSPRQTDRGDGSSGSTTSNPLEQWVKKFCEDKAENRSFTLHRQAPSLPLPILEGMVRTLLASTKYRGRLTVEFPVQHADVVILRRSGNWLTNILRLYPAKRYEVVEALWDVVGTPTSFSGAEEEFAGEGRSANPAAPSRSRDNSGGGSSADSTDGTQDRSGHAGLVAQEWWREWQFAIWNAVLGGKKGWVTVEDWIEAKMGVREKERGRDWGVDYE